MINTDAAQTAQQLLTWAQDHWLDRALPWRLASEPQVRRVVVEALLAQTRAEAVAERYAWIFEGVTDADSLHRNQERVVERSLTLGLPKIKRPAIESCTEWLVYRGGPADPSWIEGKPGIGEYTWGMLACLGGHAAAPVDCNVIRVAQRVNPEVTPAVWIGEVLDAAVNLEAQALAAFPNSYVLISGVLDLGARLCRIGAAPRCNECPLKNGCDFAENGARQFEMW
jgi:adenine-specific DNA glycosylase